jgi:hypothetical protein
MKNVKVTINQFTPTTFQIASVISARENSKKIDCVVDHIMTDVSYNVYQNDVMIGQFANLQDALDAYNEIW